MGNVIRFPGRADETDEEGGHPFVFRFEIQRAANGDVSMSEECNRPLSECLHLVEYFRDIAAIVETGADQILGGWPTKAMRLEAPTPPPD